jgi:transposase
MEDQVNIERHYEKLLQLPEPWKVKEVEKVEGGNCIQIRIGHKRLSRFECPCCQKQVPVHDHAPVRKWRHLNIMQYRVEIYCEPPRCKCQQCGVKTITVPWAETYSRNTFFLKLTPFRY